MNNNNHRLLKLGISIVKELNNGQNQSLTKIKKQLLKVKELQQNIDDFQNGKSLLQEL